MRHIKLSVLKTTLLCVSGLGLFAANTPAVAGGCGMGVSPALCQTGTIVNPGTGPVFDNASVNINQPMGYLRSVNYQRSPHTSITRVHGLADTAALTDFPSSFSGGCHPSSTAYCRQDAGTPVNVEFNGPQAPMPTYNFAPQMMAAPMISAPAAPRIIAVGGGYDPSKFVPRQYGEFTFTPGTVYAPTSYINRNPADAARVLAENGYTTGSYSSTGSYGGGTMSLSAPMMSTPALSAPLPSAAPVMPTMPAPNMFGGLAGGPVPQGGTYLGSVVTGQTTTGGGAPTGNAVSGVDSTGGYWEKVSGLTMFGDTVATSVVCRRQAPQQTAQVVSPVYGIPQPIPTPVPQYIDVPYKVRGGVMPQGCRPASAPIAPPRFGGGFGMAPPAPHMGFRAPHMSPGWTY